MSNSIKNIINNVFFNLEEIASKDLPYITKDRYINPHQIAKKDDKITDILKYTKYKIINISHNIKAMFLFYNSEYFLIYPFDLDCPDFGNIESEEEFVIGFGIIAISENLLMPHEGVDFKIYNNILASTLNSFNFEDISCFYKNYTIIKLNEINFKEDIYRFTGLLLANNLPYTSNALSLKTYDNLLQLLNLKSSRCISSCIVRCLDSSLLDHCFLEIYRCLEFLFYLQTAIDISDKYNNKNLYLLIDLVYNREIVHKERDSLYAIIKNINDSYCIDNFYDFLICNNYIDIPKNENKHHSISEHIYDLRCKTTHLKYKHEPIISNYKWDIMIEYFSALVYKIYLSLDEIILNICDSNNDWENIEYIWTK